MGLSRVEFCLVLFTSLVLFSAPSASTVISDGVFESSVSGQRRLLQAKKPCPVNFEFQNYTIIVSRCKGPKYLPNLCCPALKDFACPFADQINDLSTDCADTMFSYINLNGKYPPGLFASECREGMQGLECPASSPSASETSIGIQTTCRLLTVLLFAAASFALSLSLV